jgi:mannitol-specific phosphotransferase system IIBC component
MNKTTLIFLLGSGILLCLSEFLGKDNIISAYIVVFVMAFAMVYFVLATTRQKQKDLANEAFETMRDEQKVRMARKEVKSKIPKNSPRRESKAAFEGATKLGTARSMATLVRKPRLREKILEICDFADMVLETIRHMPEDTPAAIAFAEHHLAKLNESLERCFEMSRSDEYKHAPASLDAHEIECFGTFITAFRKQQDNILIEGKN